MAAKLHEFLYALPGEEQPVKVSAWRYDPQARAPENIRARATSVGPQAVISRPDGVTMHALPHDWVVWVGDQMPIVLNAPSFETLFPNVARKAVER